MVWFPCVYCPSLMISIDEHRFFMEWLNPRWLNGGYGGWTDEHPAILMWTGGHRNWECTSKNMEMTSRIEGESWLVNIKDDLSDLSRRNEEFDHQHSKTSSSPSLPGFTFLTSLQWHFFLKTFNHHFISHVSSIIILLWKFNFSDFFLFFSQFTVCFCLEKLRPSFLKEAYLSGSWWMVVW